MQRFIGICLLLFLLVYPAAGSGLNEGETIELQVLGEAFIVEGNTAKAREMAISHGLHQAVEQAVGSLVYSETNVENFHLVKDSIRLRSAGYVSGYDIDDIWVEQNIYKVLLTVRVKPDAIRDDLAELRLNLRLAGDPRVMVRISTVGSHLTTRGMESILMDGLKQAGYNVVNSQQQSAVQDQADVLVLGEISGGQIGSYQGLISCRVNVEIKVVKTDTSEVLAVRHLQQTGVHLTETAAAEKALRQAGEQLVPTLLTDLARTLTEPHELTVEIGNVSYQQLVTIRRYLQETPLVDLVQLREFTGRKALITVETNLSAPQLADEIIGWHGFAVVINGVSPHKIELTVTLTK
jgi:hypothetical protein